MYIISQLSQKGFLFLIPQFLLIWNSFFFMINPVFQIIRFQLVLLFVLYLHILFQWLFRVIGVLQLLMSVNILNIIFLKLT